MDQNYNGYNQQYGGYNQPNYGYNNQQNGGYNNERPKTYLVWSILSLIFCCLPFGIVATVFSAKVDSYWNNGNYAAAYDASRKAKTWLLVSVISGVFFDILYIIFVTIGVASGLDLFDLR